MMIIEDAVMPDFGKTREIIIYTYFSRTMKIDQFFNPSEHLVFHQDKDGNMIGGGYKVNNILYQNKMPLFVSPMTGGGGGSGSGSGSGHDDEENPHFRSEEHTSELQSH